MQEDLNERGRQILEAVVEDYIASAEPVGSRAVTRRHALGLSPATVRNVMSDLEELGFLASPHTSAGRIPTDKGYRFYVDSLLQVRDLSEAEQEAIGSQYRLEGQGTEDLLQGAGRILSVLSKYTGVVMVPRLTTTVFRHIGFLRLAPTRLLVVFVTQSGLVQNKIVEVDEPIPQSELDQMSNYLNRTLTGLTIQEVRERVVAEMSQDKALYDKLLSQALRLSGQAFAEEFGGQVFIEGTANILEQPEFADVERMKRLFRTFEQKSQLVELLDRSQGAEGVKIFIGSESRYSQIEGCSLIAATYSGSRGSVGTLGVIGPNRMPYSTLIPIVDFTARLVSKVLKTQTD